jgi:hypothetical protein
MPMLRTCLSLAAAVLTSAIAVAQEPNSSMVVVFDASGSMYGRVGADIKIDAAKSVLRDVLKDVPREVEVGLVVYGHRRPGDCADIETVAPLGSNPADIATRVQSISPKGRTPIADSLRAAAKLFAGKDRPSTLLLISDGIETCQGDPCALAKELKAQGTKLVIHTVGFGVGADAASQLQCIAKEGGGRYYDAKDRTALGKALFEVRQSVVEQRPPPPPPVVEPPKAEIPKTKTIQIAGPGTIKLKPAPWVKMPVRWTIIDPESGEQKGQASADSMRIKAGEYQIVWRQGQYESTDVPLSSIVNVPAGQTIEVPIDTGLRIVAPPGTAAPSRWWLRREGEKEPLAAFSGTLDPQVVPAGRYELGWHQDQYGSAEVVLGAIEIAPGKLNEHRLDYGLNVQKAEWVPGDPANFRLTTKDGQELGRWAKFGVHFAPPGQYVLVYRQSQYGHNDIVWGEVIVPAHGFAKVAIDSGIRFKPQAGAKPPYRAYFIDLDTKAEHYWSGGENWQPVPLPPGRYRLDWHEAQYGTERTTLLDEFKVEPGTLVELQM